MHWLVSFFWFVIVYEGYAQISKRWKRALAKAGAVKASEAALYMGSYRLHAEQCDQGREMTSTPICEECRDTAGTVLGGATELCYLVERPPMKVSK